MRRAWTFRLNVADSMIADPRSNSKMHRVEPGFHNAQLRVEAESQIAAWIQKDFQPILHASPDSISCLNLAARCRDFALRSRKRLADVPQGS